MLFILTGDIQIGKTRWLERLVSHLADQGVQCSGVIAPGCWISSDSDFADDNGFEKTGIDNVLLPQGERVHFALRPGIARSQGFVTSEGQSGKAKLGWHIFDDAIERVNQHFGSLAQAEQGGLRELLVVDELGRLELLRDEGLTLAMDLLAKGPFEGREHALVVVREVLADVAEERFAEVWGGCCRLSPSQECFRRICALYNDERIEDACLP